MSKRYPIFLFLIGLSLSTVAQDLIDKKYYRHFHVQVKNLTNEEYSDLKNSFSETEHFETISYCKLTPGILIQVDASYPARVSQIESEIKGFVLQQITVRRITSIESISDLDKSNFCK